MRHPARVRPLSDGARRVHRRRGGGRRVDDARPERRTPNTVPHGRPEPPRLRRHTPRPSRAAAPPTGNRPRSATRTRTCPQGPGRESRPRPEHSPRTPRPCLTLRRAPSRAPSGRRAEPPASVRRANRPRLFPMRFPTSMPRQPASAGPLRTPPDPSVSGPPRRPCRRGLVGVAPDLRAGHRGDSQRHDPSEGIEPHGPRLGVVPDLLPDHGAGARPDGVRPVASGWCPGLASVGCGRPPPVRPVCTCVGRIMSWPSTRAGWEPMTSRWRSTTPRPTP
ncbi:hypothetical protein PRAC110570_09365 [Propionibacterium acidifaciens]